MFNGHTMAVLVKHTETILCDGNIRADEKKLPLTNRQSDDVFDQILELETDWHGSDCLGSHAFV